MSSLPRVALGALELATELQVVFWALADVLERRGLRVQSYLSRSYFAGPDGAMGTSASSPRHLDSWLMPPRICRDAFARTAAQTDIAVIHGMFDGGRSEAAGASLDVLCRWLDLPRIAVVDASRCSDCRLPPRPENVDGLILDKVSCRRQRFTLQTNLEALWGVPVLGALERPSLPESAIDELPHGTMPSREVAALLGSRLLRDFDLERFLLLASSRPFSRLATTNQRPRSAEPLRIAVAYDDAFNCYFPDTLDLLEQSGATVCDFSPLRDECLPPDTDIVYFGCGHPERFADRLAANHCLINDLRSHVCEGKRIYAEGGGLVYLGRAAEVDSGARHPMAGILPTVARHNPSRSAPRPVEVQLRRDCWLGPAGSALRGYLNDGWTIDRCGPLNCYGGADGSRMDLVGRHQVIGSRLHLNFAAQPHLFRRFLTPCPAALDLVGSRAFSGGDD